MANSFQEELTERFGPTAEQDGGLTGGDVGDPAFLHRVLTRRTHRRYADRPVEPALTDLLCAAALSASSKSDFQQASIVRVADPARRAALAALVPSMPWIGAAPLFLVFCGDARRLQRIGELRSHPQDNGNLEGFFNAAVDAALVMQTFILAAESAGLGCCPISVLRNKVDAVGEILSLPEKVFPVAGLCVGWPAGEGHVSMRLPPAVTLHVDRYDDSDLPAQIDRYDRMRDARHSIPPDQQRAPERFGTAEFYGWSEDKARQAAMPEGAAFPPWLRRQGFSFD
ncbi:MAG TPA: nitroreductase family protein [Stellaceae bacterium]|jgi:nitroreductase